MTRVQPTLVDPSRDQDVTVRPARESDLDAITEVYNESVRTTTATFDTAPKSRDERLRWFESHGPRHPIIVAERDGAVVGWACLSPWSDRPAYAETAETSFYVKQEHRGKSIGRHLKQALIDEARRLRFHSLIACVAQGSVESLHLNESLGFVHVGTLKEVGRKFGRLLDVHLLQKILDHEESATDPSPEELLETAIRDNPTADRLLELARQLRDRGLSQNELTDLFERFRAQHESDEDESVYDAILDAMDFIAGWCRADQRLFPDSDQPRL